MTRIARDELEIGEPLVRRGLDEQFRSGPIGSCAGSIRPARRRPLPHQLESLRVGVAVPAPLASVEGAISRPH